MAQSVPLAKTGKFDLRGGLIPHTLLSYPRSHPRILQSGTSRTAYLLVLYVKVVCSYALFQLKLEILSAPFSSLFENPLPLLLSGRWKLLLNLGDVESRALY